MPAGGPLTVTASRISGAQSGIVRWSDKVPEIKTGIPPGSPRSRKSSDSAVFPDIRNGNLIKKEIFTMNDSNKAKVGIHMKPDLIARVDAEYPLYDYPSRSAFVCAATEFYLGYLHSQSDADYMSKTTLAFLEDQATKLDAKICRQLFRLCVELSMVAHVTATTVPGANEETLKRLRTKCVKDVKNTIGNIRYDSIYAHQHSLPSEDDYE